MTKEYMKEVLPVIQAWTEGKTIQTYHNIQGWQDMKEAEIHLTLSSNMYRIKPEPREFWIREYKDKTKSIHHDEGEAKALCCEIPYTVIHVKEVL